MLASVLHGCGFEHCFDRNRACYHVVEIGEEALALIWVQLDGAEESLNWKYRRPRRLVGKAPA